MVGKRVPQKLTPKIIIFDLLFAYANALRDA